MAELAIEVTIADSFADHVAPDLLSRAVAAALEVAGDDRNQPFERARVNVRVTDDAEIHELNRTYRKVDRPTDVLSFAFLDSASPLPPDWPLELGDVIISYPYSQRQAAHLGHPVDMELAWLAIHGTLQLAGYHHAEEGQAAHMESLERRALDALGFRP